jgi:hypothetical protein
VNQLKGPKDRAQKAPITVPHCGEKLNRFCGDFPIANTT